MRVLSWQLADTPAARAHERRVRVDEFGQPNDCVVSVDVTLGYREPLDVVAVLRELGTQKDELARVDPRPPTISYPSRILS